jgi:hypothetical protein
MKMRPFAENALGKRGGIHPHGDGKSPQAIERKEVAGVHCAKECGSH